MSMELNEYQKKAMSTCLPSCDNIAYMSLGLVSEVGELAGKIAKAIRKEELKIDSNELIKRDKVSEEEMMSIRAGIVGEIGDCAWFLAGICHTLGLSLEEVATANLAKLAERKKNGTIIGNGDGVTKEERQ